MVELSDENDSNLSLFELQSVIIDFIISVVRSQFTLISLTMMQFRRKEEQTKKDYYRRIAEGKKMNWAALHHLQDDQNYKSHFALQDQDLTHDLPKNKKIAKIEYRTEQRLRNRVAAQESRERHRSYVDQLQRKVDVYQTLLQNNGSLCRNCKRDLSKENTETESILEESISPEEYSKLPVDMASQQAILNSYLDDQIVRIDNQGETSPFSIFFILCLVGVVAIFSLQPDNGGMAPRLLTNYHSTLNQLISQQDMPPHEGLKDHSDLPLLLESTISGQQQAVRKDSSRGGLPVQASVESGSNKTEVVDQNWTKYGKYMCSKPQVLLDKGRERSRQGPQFLLLRTGRNTIRQQSKRGVEEDSQNNNFKIFPQNWQRLQISTCFLGEM